MEIHSWGGRGQSQLVGWMWLSSFLFLPSFRSSSFYLFYLAIFNRSHNAYTFGWFLYESSRLWHFRFLFGLLCLPSKRKHVYHKIELSIFFADTYTYKNFILQYTLIRQHVAGKWKSPLLFLLIKTWTFCKRAYTSILATWLPALFLSIEWLIMV